MNNTHARKSACNSFAISGFVIGQLHSLMLVLLNGGENMRAFSSTECVALVDACVTEWRNIHPTLPMALKMVVALVDACVTEWRQRAKCPGVGYFWELHSLMLVLLNGGGQCGGTSHR